MLERVFTLTLVGCCAFLIGCSKQQAPEYDGISLDVTLDLIRAYQKQDQELAATKLTRLQAIAIEAPGLYELAQEQINQAALAELQEHLEQDDLDSGLSDLKKWIRQAGRDPVLHGAKTQVDQLVLVREYLQMAPPSSATTAAQRLGELPAPTQFANSRQYAIWHHAESLKVAEMLTAERKARIAKLEASLDERLVHRALGVQKDLDDLAALKQDHPVGQVWSNLSGGELSLKDIASIKKDASRELAIYTVIYYGIITGKQRSDQLRVPSDLLVLAANQKGVTQSGRFAKAYAAFQTGKHGKGLAALADLHRHDPEHLIDVTMIRAKMPTLQGTPGISVTDLMQALTSYSSRRK